MDGRINVSIPELQEAITKFNNCKQQMAAAYGQMATEVMSLNASWNGAASEGFVNRFSELTANIKTSDATIEQAVAGLKVAVDQYTAVEEAAKAALDGMTDATSPF